MPVDVAIMEDAALLRLSGEVGLAEVARVKAALAAAALEKREVRLNIAELSGIDAALLQLVHALRCSSRGRGCRVIRVSPVQAAVAQAAADAGAAGLGCGRVCGHPSCIFEEF